MLKIHKFLNVAIISIIFSNIIVITTYMTAEGEIKIFFALDSWKSSNNIDDDNDNIIDFAEQDWNEGIYSIETALVETTENVKIFVEQEIEIETSTITELGVEIENALISITSKFGSLPDVNGDDHISLILLDIRDEKYYGLSNIMIQGYFWPIQSKQSSTSGIQAYSHFEEILYIDFEMVTRNKFPDIFVHEVQHLIQYANHFNQDLWLDEGFSVFFQDLCGFTSDPYTYSRNVFDNPRIIDTSLTYFENEMINYGLSYLFVKYLTYNYGEEILRSVLDSSSVGMNAVIESLNQIMNNDITSSEIVNKFSIALAANTFVDNEFHIPGFFNTIFSVITVMDEQLESGIKGWGMRAFRIIGNQDSGIKFKFIGDKIDSFGNVVTYWLSVLTFNKTSSKYWSYSVDPLSGESEGLWPINKIEGGDTYIVINAYSGESSGSNPGTPPESNFTLFVNNYEGDLFIPGTIHLMNRNLFNIGARVYIDNQEELTNENVLIAQYYILDSGNNEILTEGDLIFSTSGWLTPNIDLKQYSSGKIKIKYVFFDGTNTHTYYSESITLNSEIKNNQWNIIDNFVPILGFLGVFVMITVPLLKLKRMKITNIDDPIKLTKLKPMFKSDDKAKKKVVIRNRKIKLE